MALHAKQLPPSWPALSKLAPLDMHRPVQRSPAARKAGQTVKDQEHDLSPAKHVGYAAVGGEQHDDPEELGLSEDGCRSPMHSLHLAVAKQPKCSVPLLTAGFHVGLKEHSSLKHPAREPKGAMKRSAEPDTNHSTRLIGSSSLAKLGGKGSKSPLCNALESAHRKQGVLRRSSSGPWKSERTTLASVCVGNVVKTKREVRSSGLTIACGQLGRVQEVNSDGSSMIMFNDTPVLITRKDVSDMELQQVTHEVELINTLGQQVGKFLPCIVCEDHGDGFLDILCQDGRREPYTHSAFVKPLPASHCTDVGYSPSVKPAASASAVSPKTSTSDRVSLRMAELLVAKNMNGPVSTHSSMAELRDVCELPPAGLEKQQRSQGLFAAGSALRALRSSKALHDQSGATLDSCDTSIEAKDGEQGSVCPFMEIQETGLLNLAAAVSFTSKDVVFDLGCGTGKILDKVLTCFPCKGVAVDCNCSLARKAEQRLQRYGQRARVLVEDVRNVDFESATATVSYFLSHSFQAQGASLKEHLSRRLRKGCVVYNYTYPIPGWSGSCSHGWHKYVIGEHLPDSS